MRTTQTTVTIILICVLVLSLGLGLPTYYYAVDWHTFDGGGEQTSSAPNGYAIAGTIGQPDAQPEAHMTGESYEIVGGFWSASIDICSLLADVNEDGLVDGQDVQTFVDCILGAELNCACADIDEDDNVTLADQSLFITALTMP